MITNRQTNLDQGITQTDLITTDRQQTDTRLKTKETKTNHIVKAKTNNKNKNKNQRQQPQIKLSSNITLKSGNYNNSKQRIHNNRKTLQLENLKLHQPETQIVPETQTQETTQFSFHSPSMVTKNVYQIPNSTPETIDVTTPENNEPNTKETASTPTLQHEQHQRAKTFATRLYQMNFVDIGYFLNATLKEKENLTALAMYYTLGDYDPSNKFIKTFTNKDIINTYKIITEAKTTKTNTLSRIYQHLNAINNRVEQRKLSKNKHKNT